MRQRSSHTYAAQNKPNKPAARTSLQDRDLGHPRILQGLEVDLQKVGVGVRWGRWGAGGVGEWTMPGAGWGVGVRGLEVATKGSQVGNNK